MIFSKCKMSHLANYQNVARKWKLSFQYWIYYIFQYNWSLENPLKTKQKNSYILHCISVWLTCDGIIGGILLVQNVLCSEIIIFS